ncbi:MAG TPA: U32 family peptidase [Candidatus Pacearchaeota archaeon]|nr:U32 family peptidase [Candidatus Pacearchaeota archaeon]HPR79948.1 U32 family peptidase [Candidatus Pacearchaeota archaeon]
MEKQIKEIELLAPAKNLNTGIAAINAGADAVYIGAPKFGARAAASNSLEEIEKLIDYAHQFRVKVYITLNTILFDNELKEANDLIWSLYNLKVDGIIIQDMGILEMDLPPVTLIASTQTDNYSLERIKFLEDIGFKRIILARELSLEQIKEIRDNTNLELESFVHGALCVSFSGRCYLSSYLSGRSANRGECIQACRLPYTLVDGENNVIAKNKPLLCLKDFNLSNNLEELIDAGITSFKIEGRLKDEDYVSNVVAYYNKKLNSIKKIKRTSTGIVSLGFEPDLEKTFHRTYTIYFLKGRQKDILSSSPKSIGKLLGRVKDVLNDYFILENDVEINNGDGLCYFDKFGNLIGSNVNVVLGNKIFLNDMSGIIKGLDIYRNTDTKFLKSIKAERKIPLSFSFKENSKGFSLVVKDDDGNQGIGEIKINKQEAEKKEKAIENVINQLGKLGETIYTIKEINIKWKKPYFIPISQINEMRREAIDNLSFERKKNYKIEEFKIKDNNIQFITKKLSYEWNVSNKLAEKFYKKHGVVDIEPAFEIKKRDKVMTTKHCLKNYFGFCPKDHKIIKEPLYLINEKGQKFLLKFNCISCQMEVIVVEK